MAAGDFEGVHEGAKRGSGAVIVWDEGTVEIAAVAGSRRRVIRASQAAHSTLGWRACTSSSMTSWCASARIWTSPYDAASTSRAARSPELIAPSMYPFQ
jgi:hypothetical protein